MDLNPREAVVDQESSHTSEQEEEPTQALIIPVIVPENFVVEAMDSLNRLARGPERVVLGTYCYYTGKRPHRDHQCGDVN